MTFDTIRKSAGREPVSPNLTDYERTRRRFTWDDARKLLPGLPAGGLNIAWEASVGAMSSSRFWGRVPELHIAALGALKAGAVFSPLFSAFGPGPVQQRMTIGKASALVTTQRFYERKVEPWRRELSSLEFVLLTDCHGALPADCANLETLLAEAPAEFDTVSTRQMFLGHVVTLDGATAYLASRLEE